MQLAQLSSLLEKHVPPDSLEYCLRLWQEYPFQFTLRQSRVTKLGDFSCRPGQSPRITVNGDSHPYIFLLTYVHEVAHLRVHCRLGWKAAPHGREWKDAFRTLCEPLFALAVFPEDVADALRLHLRNPKASSLTDGHLTRVLHQYDEEKRDALRLADLPEGSQFQIRGRWFAKGKLRRTRVLCKEIASRRNYLIAADALVGSDR